MTTTATSEAGAIQRRGETFPSHNATARSAPMRISAARAGVAQYAASRPQRHATRGAAAAKIAVSATMIRVRLTPRRRANTARPQNVSGQIQ